MKKTTKYMMLAFAGLLWACEADPDEGLPNFDNSLPLYVQVGNVSNNNSDGDATTSPEEGDNFTINVELPEVVYNDVNVQWELTGDLSGSGTTTVTEGNLSSGVIVAIPDDGLAGGGTAMFTLTSVDNGLTLGRQNASTSVISTELEWADND